MEREDIARQVKESGLKGRGALVSTGLKWELALKEKSDKNT